MFSFHERLYFKMAVLHIIRRRGRAGLVAMMIALSLIGLLLMEGMYEGMMVQVTQNTIKTGSGAVTIQHPSFRGDQNIKYGIEDPQRVTAFLDHIPEVTSYVSRVTQGGLIATAGYSQRVTVMGVHLEDEAKHANLPTFMVGGAYHFEKRGRGAIIGYRLARKLKVGLGKKVIVTMQDVNNEVVSVALKVRGMIKTNNRAIDEYGLLMDRKRLQTLTGLKGVTEIALLLEDQDRDFQVKEVLTSQLKDDTLAVYSYKELYPMLYESEAMMETYSSISAAFIFIVATLGIFGVVLVSVLERVREFGIMMAIGTKFRDIMRLIIYESLVITMAGYLLGVLVGGGLLWYFHLYGLDLSGWSDAFAIFGMDANIHALIKLEYFSSALISVVLATLAATIIPIRTLKQRNPMQSINEQGT